MITQIFPKDFQRYMSLPVLGPFMDSFAEWLQDHRYTWRSTRFEMRIAALVCRYLKRRGIRTVVELSEHHLQACYRLFRRKIPSEAGSVRVLQTFLVEQGLVQRTDARQPNHCDVHLNAFAAHLRDCRGYSPPTIRQQVNVASEFLAWLNFEKEPNRLACLKTEDIDGFSLQLGKRLGRAAMQKSISTMRNFLRFLAAGGIVAPGLDSKIDRPRIYREEKLPRALPWTTVQAFLGSINRDMGIGKRDYAMFSLMATYGLRACDVVALSLDDIQWRAGVIRICQTKTGKPLELPLTDEVGAAIVDYLRNVPRYGVFRNLFLRLKAPGGSLKATAVTEAFQAWAIRSRLDISFKGAHCLGTPTK
jgi:site-specific recombinase XerD